MSTESDANIWQRRMLDVMKRTTFARSGAGRMTLRVVLLSAVSAFGFAVAVAGCASDHTQVSAPSNTPTWLRAEAMKAAAALGDKHPRLIHIFVGRYDKIVMHGRFRCPQCSRPPGDTS